MALVTAVLCGGKGRRAWPLTASVPKPLLPVGGTPLLRAVLGIYAEQGHDSFVLAAGYRCEAVAGFARTLPRSWSVEVVDTGMDTGTGERLRRVRFLLGREFFATYGDGVADVDLDALLAAHRRSGRAATLTAVPLRSQYGTLTLGEDERVRDFHEKPVLADHWINGGFFALDAAIFDHWPGPDLERDVLPALAARGELSVHRHRGFWRSVDTEKDLEELADRAEREGLPGLPASAWRQRESA
jgi:glucose-1-phosphate cytidylyltransferase